MNQSNTSLRSLFTAKSKSQQSSSQQSNRDSVEIDQVQSDEEDEDNLSSIEETPGLRPEMREEIEKQVSEKNQSQEKKTKGSLKVEDRCGKPLNCTV